MSLDTPAWYDKAGVRFPDGSDLTGGETDCVKPVEAQEPVAWVQLSDSQWMNIVNHNRGYEDHSKEDAVEEAVRLTEARLKMNNKVPPKCARCAELQAKIAAAEKVIDECEAALTSPHRCSRDAERNKALNAIAEYKKGAV